MDEIGMNMEVSLFKPWDNRHSLVQVECLFTCHTQMLILQTKRRGL